MSDHLTWDLIVNDKSQPAVDDFGRNLDKAGKHVKAANGELKDLGEESDKFSRKLEDGSKKFTKFTGVVSLGSFALTHAAAATHGLVSAAISLSGVAGLLPGIVGAGAASLITLKVATHGVADAISESDPKKYAADLKTLAPAAGAVVTQIRKLRPELTLLRRDVQEHFFTGLSADLKPIAEKWLPKLHTGMDGVATELGNDAKEIEKFLKSNAGVRDMSTLFDNVKTAIRNSGVSIQPLLTGLSDTIAASSKWLPVLGIAVGDLGVKVGKYLTAITNGGKGASGFDTWVKNGLHATKELGVGIKAIGKILGDVFSAGGKTNGSALDILATQLQAISVQIDKPAFKAGLATVFKGIASASKSISDTLPAVGDALINIAPALGNIASGSGAAFAAIVEDTAHNLDLWAPSLNTISAILLPLAPVIGRVAEATYIWAKANQAVNLAMKQNIYVRIALLIILIGAALVTAYKKSELFRAIVQAVFKAVANAILNTLQVILSAISGVFTILGHLPGKLGAPFRAAAGAINAAKGEVDALKHAIDRIQPKTVTVRVNTELAVYGSSGGHYEGSTFVPNKRRAAGGHVRAGESYVVGEHRPELFVPSTGGTILPRVGAGAVGGGSGGGITVNVHVHGSLLATHKDIHDAVVTAFKHAPAGARKLPAGAVGAR